MRCRNQPCAGKQTAAPAAKFCNSVSSVTGDKYFSLLWFHFLIKKLHYLAADSLGMCGKQRVNNKRTHTCSPCIQYIASVNSCSKCKYMWSLWEIWGEEPLSSLYVLTQSHTSVWWQSGTISALTNWVFGTINCPLKHGH